MVNLFGAKRQTVCEKGKGGDEGGWGRREGERRTETAVEPAKVQGRYRMKKRESKYVKTTSAG